MCGVLFRNGGEATCPYCGGPGIIEILTTLKEGYQWCSYHCFDRTCVSQDDWANGPTQWVNRLSQFLDWVYHP